VVCRRQPRRAGPDDEDPLAGELGGRRLEGPALAEGLVAEEALDGVDADGLVDLGAVTGGLAGVVADPAHDRRERVVLDDLPPGRLVGPLLGVEQPLLDVLTGRAGLVARGQQVDVDRPLGAPTAGLVGQAGADVEGDGEGLLHHAFASSAMGGRVGEVASGSSP
jgi:hypothetical protein